MVLFLLSCHTRTDSTENPDDTDTAMTDDSVDNSDTGTSDSGTTSVTLPRVGDLYLEDAAAKVSGATVNRQIGETIAAAGDLNGDGLADLVLGVPQTGVDDFGYALIYHGQTNVSAITDTQTILRGPGVADGTGYAVAMAGDVDSDGVGDLWVSRVYDATNGYHAGAVELLYGPIHEGDIADLPHQTVFGVAASDRFGESVLPLGDLDGDGFADVGIGQLGLDTGAFLIFDGQTVAASSLPTANLAQTEFVGRADDGLGGVASVSDLDGDGVLDLVLGAPDADGASVQSGAVYVFYNIDRSGVTDVSDADARIMGNTANATFGASVATGAGQDYNGDGRPDLAVGEPKSSNAGTWSGAAYIFSSVTDGQNASEADAKILGSDAGLQLGYSVALARLDSDSSDLFVGLPARDASTSTGEVWQIYAPSEGTITTPAARWTGFNDADNTGYKLQNLGDVNGDDGEEVAVGSPYANRVATHGGVVSVVTGERQ